MKRWGPKVVIQALLGGRAFFELLTALHVGERPLGLPGISEAFQVQVCIGTSMVVSAAFDNVVQVMAVSLVRPAERGTLLCISRSFDALPGLLPLTWLFRCGPQALWACAAVSSLALCQLLRHSQLMKARLKDS